MQRQSSLQPGGVVTYSIWVWSTVSAQRVRVSAVSSAQTREPRFTALCPVANRSRCSLGSVAAGQAFGLVITDKIQPAATAAQVTLSVVVQAAGMSPAEATITTLLGPSPSPTPSSPTPTTLPPVVYPAFPETTIGPSDLTSLFPVVTPTASPATAPHTARRHHLATVTSSALPLNPRLIGGQLAALAVLAAAVTMAVARLSLRTVPDGETKDD